MTETIPASSRAARALGDAALVEAMRHGDAAALREFLLRFELLLEHHAHRLGASGAERDDLVGETLEDAALALVAPNATTPRSIPAYLVAALRNRLLNARRGARGATIARVREPSPREALAADEGLCSESALRASVGPAWEPRRPSRAVAALASVLLAELSEEERVLLIWVSNHVPYREIAQWLGIGYAAVGKRVERLRARLRARADAHLASLGESDRVALETLFLRGGPLTSRVVSPPALRAARVSSAAAVAEGLPPDRTDD